MSVTKLKAGECISTSLTDGEGRAEGAREGVTLEIEDESLRRERLLLHKQPLKN